MLGTKSWIYCWFFPNDLSLLVFFFFLSYFDIKGNFMLVIHSAQSLRICCHQEFLWKDMMSSKAAQQSSLLHTSTDVLKRELPKRWEMLLWANVTHFHLGSLEIAAQGHQRLGRHVSKCLPFQISSRSTCCLAKAKPTLGFIT